MVYTANWGIICYLPPVKGTRNNHWYVEDFNHKRSRAGHPPRGNKYIWPANGDMQNNRSYSFDISTKSKGDTENAYYKTYYTVVFFSWVLCQCRHTVSVESVFQLERVLCVWVCVCAVCDIPVSSIQSIVLWHVFWKGGWCMIYNN